MTTHSLQLNNTARGSSRREAGGETPGPASGDSQKPGAVGGPKVPQPDPKDRALGQGRTGLAKLTEWRQLPLSYIPFLTAPAVL